jgi:hypothetical protein
MAAPTIEYTVSAVNSKHGTAKRWVQRHLRKVASRQTLKNSGGDGSIQRQLSLKRPRTAPSTGAAPIVDDTLQAPSGSIHVETALPRTHNQPPPRPERPDSSVIRDVNAWLDASINISSPPLMGGIPYWRAGIVPGVKDSSAAQHAIPLVQTPGADRPSTTNGHRTKSLRRCAKRMQVQMPSLVRTKSQRPADRKEIDRQSASMPLLAISYEDVQPGPMMLTSRSRSILRPAIQPSTAATSARPHTGLSTRRHSREHMPFRQGTPASTRFGDTESNFERRFNAMLMRAARSADSTRPSTAVAGLTREDSMGDLSDAPTYFSGPPPPSYRSRPESILTISSFGCVDGMNPMEREMSRQRAASQRGMKCKLMKFAQNFTT